MKYLFFETNVFFLISLSENGQYVQSAGHALRKNSLGYSVLVFLDK